MTREKLIKKFPYFGTQDLSHAFDPLTEVFTRDMMKGYIHHLIDSNTPFSLFIADIDNFKYVNDGFGHKAGDAVLSDIAQFLSDILGERGVVGRYGGDEFLIVSEGIVEYSDVWKIGHDINMNIGNLRFSDDALPSVTLSMGIARYPLDTTDYEELWTLADKALYRGKTKGRNCFIIYLEAKHKNLDLKATRDVAFTPMYLHAKIFNTLTETGDIAKAIRNQLRFMITYQMYDHMCIETASGMKFEMVHALSKHKEFTSLGIEGFVNIIDNSGLAYANKVSSYSSSMSEEFIESLTKQSIVSAAYCRIGAFDKVYGYIRIDMTDTVRIWQTQELNLVLDTARVIGLLLYYNNKTIEELDCGTVETVGKE